MALQEMSEKAHGAFDVVEYLRVGFRVRFRVRVRVRVAVRVRCIRRS